MLLVYIRVVHIYNNEAICNPFHVFLFITSYPYDIQLKYNWVTSRAISFFNCTRHLKFWQIALPLRGRAILQNC